MDYDAFLTRVIDEGIEAVKKDYPGSTPAKKMKREGSIEGFEACRGLKPDELKDLLHDASKTVQVAYREQSDDYWRIRCREAEIEWVCNVMGAMMVAQGLRPIVPPTARGTMKAAAILGVA
jgi:hypothetical protein